uniref:Serine/threonine-protein kinase ulk4 n=1 Tax=Sphaerodactylus townsendi TaxID=933632 RepID=A0ACB8FUA5_9SAUR
MGVLHHLRSETREEEELFIEEKGETPEEVEEAPNPDTKPKFTGDKEFPLHGFSKRKVFPFLLFFENRLRGEWKKPMANRQFSNLVKKLYASPLCADEFLQDFVITVVRLLESPSASIRAKAFLVLLQIIINNREMLLLSCQARLVMYIERDSRKGTPGKEQQSSNEYLSKCLDLLIYHIVQELPQILDDILAALANVSGRKHPSTVQAKQLKGCLPMMPVVLHLVTSQVFRPQLVTDEFLCNYGNLLYFVRSIDSGETNLRGAIGQTASEELIKTALSTLEAVIQHPALLMLYCSTVMDYILPPLVSLVSSQNVEWRLFSLRLLSETTSLLVSHEVMAEEKENLNSNNKLLSLIRDSLLPQQDLTVSDIHVKIYIYSRIVRFEQILTTPDPVPAYALKLLVALTEYSPAVTSADHLSANFCWI